MAKAMRIGVKNIIKLENELRIFSKQAIPFAIKDTLNRAAFQGMEKSRDKVETDFTNRNSYTARSFRFVKAKGSDVNSLVSGFGTVADYMLDQEQGAVITSSGEGVPIPTAYAADQEGAIPRTKAVKRPKLMQSIQIKKVSVRGNRKQRNAATINQALKEKRKYIYMKTSKGRGIFHVRRSGGNVRIRMMYDLSRKSIIVKPNPIVKPVHKRVIKSMPRLYLKALIHQQKRLRIFM